MTTLAEKVDLAKDAGTGDVTIIHADTQNDELFVWNARGVLKIRSFHRPPLHSIRVDDRDKFQINLNMTAIDWPGGVHLVSPFTHAGRCVEAHPKTTHNQFLKDPRA